VKRWLWRLLGKGPDVAVVTFCTGDPELCERMAAEVRELVPEHRHFVVTEEDWAKVRREIKTYRIGLVPVMLGTQHRELRAAAYRLAPHKILAYNSRLERHRLRLDLASFLFWRGVPLDRIYLRPWWWPWPKRERSVIPAGYKIIEGRPCTEGRRRVAVLSPYLPYPLSHGGAVRIYNLLREIARDFDVELFAFRDGDGQIGPLTEFCARIVIVEKPRYREPRWSTLLPPDVHEYRSPGMRKALAEEKRAFRYEILQVEYTQLAEYAGDILVEHDVTCDLYAQVFERERSLRAWWDYTRWKRFESRAVRRFRRVVAMSEKDAQLLGGAAVVIGNGVDLDRFRAEPAQPGRRLLFVGSFNHFPNVEAFRFFREEVWPKIVARFPDMTLTVVAGRDHALYWRQFTGETALPPDDRIRVLDFVRDVRPLYVDCNLVIVPTIVSAGTNLKVLEAMAMERAVVSTSCGCAGLGLEHDASIWIADDAESFGEGVAKLLDSPAERQRLARAARAIAERKFDWKQLGARQRELWNRL